MEPSDDSNEFTISGDDYAMVLDSLQRSTRRIWFLNGVMVGLAIGGLVLIFSL